MSVIDHTQADLLGFDDGRCHGHRLTAVSLRCLCLRIDTVSIYTGSLCFIRDCHPSLRFSHRGVYLATSVYCHHRIYIGTLTRPLLNETNESYLTKDKRGVLSLAL
jgi:hypothetical protein